MSFLRIDVGFPIAVLSFAALCIVVLRVVEAYAGHRTRKRTAQIISLAGASQKPHEDPNKQAKPPLTN